ncbi:MAG: hypothetical protein QM703_04825 [Gemmatales bacterium]
MITSAVPSTGKRRWRPWKVLLLVLLCLIVLFASYRWWHQKEMDARLEASIAATDAVDPNWRWADMVREYEKLPASPNFPQLLLPWRGYRGWNNDDINTRPGAIDYSPDLSEFFSVRFPAPYFKILKDRLDESGVTGPTIMREALKQMAQEPWVCKVPIDGIDLHERIRVASYYLWDEMELAAHLGNEEALVSQLQSQLRLSRYTQASPKAMHCITSMTAGSKGVEGIKRAMALGKLSSSTLMQCQKILETENQLDLIQMLRKLRADHFEELEQARNDPDKLQKLKALYQDPNRFDTSTWSKRAYYWWKCLELEFAMSSLVEAQADILEISNETILLAKTNPAAFAGIDPAKIPPHVQHPINKTKHIIARQYAQALFSVARGALTCQAERSALIVALACERYRLVEGCYPKALTDLVPAYLSSVPIDPFTRNPLLYRTIPVGVVIYSVGRNGIDDGGDVCHNGNKDRGTKLFHPELRGKKYEDLDPEKKHP